MLSYYPANQSLPNDVEDHSEEEDDSQQNQQPVGDLPPVQLGDEAVGHLDTRADGVHLSLHLGDLARGANCTEERGEGRGGEGRGGEGRGNEMKVYFKCLMLNVVNMRGTPYCMEC